MKHYMIVPSIACPASCKYCFGPLGESKIMDMDIIEATANWILETDESKKIDITFHGGEPLTAGIDFYKKALPLLTNKLADRQIKFGMQSNLWLLTDEYCELFREYKVSLGTSLDGPEEINDKQRGHGYFAKTMKGINLAREYGINSACICTFTSLSMPHYKEIIDFFIDNGINISIHGAVVPVKQIKKDEIFLTNTEHGELLSKVLDYYILNIEKIKIGTIDSMIKSISSKCGGTCTFNECLGDYLVVGPNGDIYPCQRFVGMTEYKMGTVYNKPKEAQFMDSKVWKLFKYREKNIKMQCGDCTYFESCKGGCPYNVIVSYGDFNSELRDPHCAAYKMLFGRITDKAMEEVFSEDNLNMVVNKPDKDKGLLRRGKVLSIMNGSLHPKDIYENARRVLMAGALAETNFEEAYKKLHTSNSSVFPPRTRSYLYYLYTKLFTSNNEFNNIYIHITYKCNLSCPHCYAEAGIKRAEIMSVKDIIDIVISSSKAGFKKIIITGGEPLVHPDIWDIVEALKEKRESRKSSILVLRTNFTPEMNEKEIDKLNECFNHIVISVDGDKENHDKIRGIGSYDRLITNLEMIQNKESKCEIKLSATMDMADIKGKAGDGVRKLAEKLNIKDVRFKPILPIGRAENSIQNLKPEYGCFGIDSYNQLNRQANFTSSCGLGYNLYIEPNGDSYPCHAMRYKNMNIGNALENGLQNIMQSEKFIKLKDITVNNIPKCKECNMRFLCGGMCKAWDKDIYSCNELYKRAEALYIAAKEYLTIR
jgi:uncharacterized protein